jgi:hypothetical protein
MTNLCRVSLDELKHDCPLYDESVAQHRALQMLLLTGATVCGHSLQERLEDEHQFASDFVDRGEQRIMDRYLERGAYASLVEQEASILASIIMG